MKAMLEVTRWQVEHRQPNHVYWMDGEKVVAYSAWGTEAPFYFRSPSALNRRGRQFKEVPNTYGFRETKPIADEQVWTIKGSKGDDYVVKYAENTYSCTCAGWRFRGECRHIKEVEQSCASI